MVGETSRGYRRAPLRHHARLARSSATAISTRSTCSSTDTVGALIDWSTAVLADPHYDLAFTTLMLANPPLGGPAPLRAATRAIGTRLANRFLRSYEQQSGRSVDPERLGWGRRAHALRALVEIATWEANDTIDAHRGHPWLTMRPMLERELGRAG